jgi:hypothetical protein
MHVSTYLYFGLAWVALSKRQNYRFSQKPGMQQEKRMMPAESCNCLFFINPSFSSTIFNTNSPNLIGNKIINESDS